MIALVMCGIGLSAGVFGASTVWNVALSDEQLLTDESYEEQLQDLLSWLY